MTWRVRRQPEMDSGDSPSDGDLLDRIARRDATAFALLYARYSRVAYALAYRILAETVETEEVVQDAFLSVWLHPLTHESIRHTARSWLLAVVRHRARLPTPPHPARLSAALLGRRAPATQQCRHV